jgi:glycosyltransferase involved in cell wall biosynthesis
LRALKVLHVITGLRSGGAEMMLLKLLTEFSHEGDPDGEVLCLSGPGSLEPRIAALGVQVTNIGMAPGLLAFAKYPRLRRAIAAAKPDIVQCWMYHANLMGWLALGLRSGPPLVWGLRQSNLDRVRSKKLTILVAHMGAWVSRWAAERIVCVSGSVRDVHVAMGYDAAKSSVIPNGFDADQFRPDPVARGSVRAELAVDEQAILVGLIARFHPQKDHGVFIAAARMVADQQPNIVFVLCGEQVDEENQELNRMIREAGLGDNVRLLGHRDDIARITASLDLAVSSSAFGEGFPNALGEALCCGIPAVATDVGESSVIVGDAGRVVPPEDGPAMAAAMGQIIALDFDDRRALGATGRERMIRDYAITAIARRYRELYREIVSHKRGQS